MARHRQRRLTLGGIADVAGHLGVFGGRILETRTERAAATAAWLRWPGKPAGIATQDQETSIRAK